MLHRSFILSLLFICSCTIASAHVPNIVGTISQNDIFPIEDPLLSQAYYGVLDNFPHAYSIVQNERFTLRVEMLQPHIDSSRNNVSVLIVKLPEERGRVQEIARLGAKDATWETFYEPFGGDTYRRGSSFEKELEAGSYIVEVHSPENRDKYVLVVGAREEMSIGYFETLSRLIEVKKFFDKSPVRIVESPYVYIPLLLICIVGIYIRRRLKKVQEPIFPRAPETK